MPELSPKTKQYHKERVRSLVVQQPHVSIVGMQKHLAAQSLPLDRHYIASLVRQIQTERVKRAETWTLNTALSAFQDTMTEIVSKAWEIVNDPMAERLERLAALREIRAANNDVFTKLFDAGVFERKLGTIDATIRNSPLPEDKKQIIRTCSANWGLLPAPQENGGTTTPARNP
jgi:hypothetical protein